MRTEFKPTNKRAYDLGWEDGRSGKKPFPGGTHPDYNQGYNDGMCALEEYENGFDPVWHQQ